MAEPDGAPVAQALASCAVVEHFAVHGGARLVGTVDVVGAKNSVLKLMAAALLAEGTTTITNCPEILDVPLMADVLRSLGCTVDVDHDRVAIDVPAEPGAQADYRSVSKLRASVCVLGPLVARCRRAVVPAARRRRDRLAAARHAPGRPAQARRDHRDRARPGRRRGGRPARRADLAGLPERRRHREHPDGRRAGRGHDRDRQRRARAGDRRPLHDAAADGRQDRRRRQLDADRARGDGAAAHRAPRDRRPDRGRDVGVRRGHDPRHGDRPRRRPAPPRPRPGQAAHRGGRRRGGVRRPGAGRRRSRSR